MKKQGSWFNLVGLANRAGKVISGEELVVKEIRHKHAKLVLLSEDASPNTEKKILDKATYYGVPVVRVENRTVLGNAIGKEARVVIAVLEKGFAQKLQELLR